VDSSSSSARRSKRSYTETDTFEGVVDRNKRSKAEIGETHIESGGSNMRTMESSLEDGLQDAPRSRRRRRRRRSGAGEDPVIEIGPASIVGLKNSVNGKTIHQYLGIRYAQAPTGSRR
jgi:hypothetical protein